MAGGKLEIEFVLFISMLSAIKSRRSIRSYRAEMPSDGDIRKCIEAACCAPSAHNKQPWKFFIIKNKETKDKLSRVQIYTAFLKSAPLAIAVVSEDSKHWLEDCACATMLLMLQAAELGLGTCWGAVYGDESREQHVREVLGIDKSKRVLCLLGIGYPDEKPGMKKVKSFEEAAEVVE